MNIRLLLITILVLPLIACGKPPIATTRTENPEVSVDTLFTKDGCTVYRFNDAGYKYFVRCESGSSSTQGLESCGKNCTRDVGIPGGKV